VVADGRLAFVKFIKGISDAEIICAGGMAVVVIGGEAQVVSDVEVFIESIIQTAAYIMCSWRIPRRRLLRKQGIAIDEAAGCYIIKIIAVGILI